MDDGAVNNTVIRVVETPGYEYLCVRIVGDVDPVACAVCTTALDQVAAGRGTTLCVDLADVESADTTLLSFLVRVINCAQAGTSVQLCRPSRLTRRVLHLSFLDTIATVRDDLPFASAADLTTNVGWPRHSRLRPRARRLAGIRGLG